MNKWTNENSKWNTNNNHNNNQRKKKRSKQTKKKWKNVNGQWQWQWNRYFFFVFELIFCLQKMVFDLWLKRCCCCCCSHVHCTRSDQIIVIWWIWILSRYFSELCIRFVLTTNYNHLWFWMILASHEVVADLSFAKKSSNRMPKLWRSRNERCGIVNGYSVSFTSNRVIF